MESLRQRRVALARIWAGQQESTEKESVCCTELASHFARRPVMGVEGVHRRMLREINAEATLAAVEAGYARGNGSSPPK